MSGFFKDSRVNGLSDDVDIVTARVDGHCTSIKELKEKVTTLERKNAILENTVTELSEMMKAVKKKVYLGIPVSIHKLEVEMGTLKHEQVFLTNKYDEVVYRNSKKRKAEIEKYSTKKVKVKVEAEDN